MGLRTAFGFKRHTHNPLFTLPTPTDRVWRPKYGKQGILLRWLISEWCNYRCPYCPQTHDRRADKGNGKTAHAFDNFSLATWLEAIDRHFEPYRLSLVLTGGETMLDRKNVGALINHLTAKQSVECIRIDTNAWWRPDQFPTTDFSKVTLMCTFHPSQTTEEEFITQIRLYQSAGIEIGMVNYVMDEPNVDAFPERHKKFADMGIYLHPNPLWDATGTYAERSRQVLKAYLPPLDFALRTGEPSKGKPCKFPGLSFEMDYKGMIYPGCFNSQKVSLFGPTLPERPAHVVACPKDSCHCLDKYSFLKGSERNTSLNPLAEYAKALSVTAQKRELPGHKFRQS